MNYMEQNIDWIAPTAVSVLALAVAVWAAVVAQQSKKATERSAKADEKMVEFARLDREAAETEARLRPWRETPTGKGKARITNSGGRVFNVHAKMDAHIFDVDEGRQALKVVEPGESFNVTYLLAASDTGQLTLTWSTEDRADAEQISQRLSL